MIIEMYPALSGDSFIINYGLRLDKHILIDSGFKSTYDYFLRDKLIEINQKDEMINLLVITHIDQDHITGAISLISENGSATNPNIIPIQEIWHNSYKHLQFNFSNNLTEKESDILNSYIFQGMSINKNKGHISSRQGSMLSSYIYQYKYNWNTSKNGNAIMVEQYERIKIDSDMSIIILSPLLKSLNKLKQFWETELKKQKYDFKFTKDKLFDDAYEFFMLRDASTSMKRSKKISGNLHFDINRIEDVDLDNSITNESSIAFILESDNKKLLFMGDANTDIIEKSLVNLQKYENYDLSFDIIKVSHHGSLHNISKSFLKIVNGKKWLISGNGENGNPSIDTIKLIITSNPFEYKELYFNYKFDWFDNFLNKNLMNKYSYKIICKDKETLNINI